MYYTYAIMCDIVIPMCEHWGCGEHGGYGMRGGRGHGCCGFGGPVRELSGYSRVTLAEDLKDYAEGLRAELQRVEQALKERTPEKN